MCLYRKMQRRNAQALAKYARSLPEVSQSEAFRPGTVTHIVMSHDDDCPAGRSFCAFHCTCNAGITFHREGI